MKRYMSLMVLLLFSSAIAGCTEESRGPDSNIDNAHVYVQGQTSDETICKQSIVLKGGEMYTCTFTTYQDEYIVIELDVASGSDPIDLITMDDINYQKWENGDAYYSMQSRTDLDTTGGTYGEDTVLEEGDWIIVFYNAPN